MPVTSGIILFYISPYTISSVLPVWVLLLYSESNMLFSSCS